MSTNTLSNSISTGIFLTPAGADLSPFTVTSTGTINPANGYAISSKVTNASVLNFGTLESGVYFINGGSLINSGASAVVAQRTRIEGASGTVTNNGTIGGVVRGLGLSFIGGVDISGSGYIDNRGTMTYAEIGGGIVRNSGVVSLPEYNNRSGPAIDIYGEGTVLNSGSIYSGRYGVQMSGTEVSSRLVVNSLVSSYIYGYQIGVYLDSSLAPLTVINYGTISSRKSSPPGAPPTGGVILTGRGETKSGGSTIENLGTQSNIDSVDVGNESGGFFVGTASILNQGYIGSIYFGELSGETIFAQNFEIGVTINNQGTIGSIFLGEHGGAVMNSGSAAFIGGIDSQGTASTSIFNAGTIVTSEKYGIELSGIGTVINDGTISGPLGAVVFKGNGNDRLIAGPGAYFYGGVTAQGTLNTMEFAAGHGTLGTIGSQYTGFQTIAFDQGASWSVTGDLAGLQGETVTGFAPGNTLIIDGFTETSDTYASGIGLELSNGSTNVTLDVLGSFTTGDFHVTSKSNETTLTVACFVNGTYIATPDGETAVESLNIGDRLRTQSAGDQKIKWIGHRTYEGRFIRGNPAALPICIKQHAIADNIPARDLWVSPGHAISIDGVLIHASRLVNGVSVIQVEAVDEVTYFHIELENHEIMFAENCPAETFMDEHFRQQFHNAAEFQLRYPGENAPRIPCQPRLSHGFHLHAIQTRINARAGIVAPRVTGPLRGYVDQAGPGLCFGWAQDIAAPEAPVCLDILGGGRLLGRVLANLHRADVRDAGHGSGYQGFEFPLPLEIPFPIKVQRSCDQAELGCAMAALRQAC
jgi:hypothetical protein